MVFDVSAHAVDRYMERINDSGDFVSTREKLRRLVLSIAKQFLEEMEDGGQFRLHTGSVTYCIARRGDEVKIVTCYPDRIDPRNYRPPREHGTYKGKVRR